MTKKNKKVKVKILAAGTFDILHVGHIRFLKAAKNLAENSELIVIVARDSTVQRVKGRKPIFNENERLEIINALKPVDKAVLGNENKNIFEILKEIRPDIVALGYDQNVDENKLAEWAEKNGLKIKIVRLPKFTANLDSSTKIRKIIAQLEKLELK